MRSRAAKQYHNTAGLAVLALALCVVLSGAMLFGRLLEFAAADSRHYIPLTRSGGTTTVTVQGQQMAYAPGRTGLLTASPGFRVWDENTVWQGTTEIEIFHLRYEHNGAVTVSSSDGDKVLAPGTGNTYRFALENTGNVAVEYTMNMQAWFSHEDLPIPVRARVTDHRGNFLAGTAEAMTDVLALNGVAQEGTLAAGNVLPFTLEWEWPYELNDEYDTMLGNLAAEGEEITLTIVINTTASYTPEPEEDDGIPKTGDMSQIGMMFTLMVSSFAGILILLFLGRRRREREDE